MTVAFKDWVKACQQRVEKAAENNLPQEALIPQKLHSAMRYSVIDNFFKSAGELIVSRMVVIAAYFLVSPSDDEISDFD